MEPLSDGMQQDSPRSGISTDVPPLASGARSHGFERLYRRHAGDVYRYALAMLQNPADAEDVAQTTFLNAYRAYERGEQPVAPKHWLIAIAHNVCRQRFRQSQRRPHEVEFNEELAEATVPDQKYSAEDIQRALGQLSFNQRSALVMRELEGRSYTEIAELLGLSLSAVETLLFRARRALREQLEATLTCDQAELDLSRQRDGLLSRAEKSQLRAHLRACADCASLARSQRAQRSAWRALGAIPLPTSLGSLFGGGGAAIGTGLAVKAAFVAVAGAVVAGGTYGIVEKATARAKQKPAAPAAPRDQSSRPTAGTAPSPTRDEVQVGGQTIRFGAPQTTKTSASPAAQAKERAKREPSNPTSKAASPARAPTSSTPLAPAAGAPVSPSSSDAGGDEQGNGPRSDRPKTTTRPADSAKPGKTKPATPASTKKNGAAAQSRTASPGKHNGHEKRDEKQAEKQQPDHSKAGGKAKDKDKGQGNGNKPVAVPAADVPGMDAAPVDVPDPNLPKGPPVVPPGQEKDKQKDEDKGQGGNGGEQGGDLGGGGLDLPKPGK